MFVATNTCFATIDLSFGDWDFETYRHMWEGAQAVYWMCVQHDCDGVSTGHGGSNTQHS